LVHVRGGGPRRGAQPKVVRAKGAHYLVLGGNALSGCGVCVLVRV